MHQRHTLAVAAAAVLAVGCASTAAAQPTAPDIPEQAQVAGACAAVAASYGAGVVFYQRASATAQPIIIGIVIDACLGG